MWLDSSVATLIKRYQTSDLKKYKLLGNILVVNILILYLNVSETA